MAQKERLARLCLAFATQTPIMFGFAEGVRVSLEKVRLSKTKRHPIGCLLFHGAEGETRTLAPVSRPTPLAGAPRHQLEYFCMVTYIIKFCCCRWRREWDSNPRYVAVRRFSRPFRYNHFGISAFDSLDILSYGNQNVNRF